MSSSIRRGMWLACLGCLLIITPAAAQTTRDISLGYSFLWLDDDEAPGGWQVGYASEITPLMRWVADFSGHYGGEASIHLFQGGLRFGHRRTEAVVPFATALVGGGYGARNEDDESEMTFTAQLGAGLDFVFRPDGPGIRAQVDFPVFFVGDEPQVGVRMTVGFVIPIK